MANKEKIDYLLLDIRTLEKRIAEMRDADLYPVSFFSETYELLHKLVNELHLLESEQVDRLRHEMEAHRLLIEAIPHREAMEQPTAEPAEKDPQMITHEPPRMEEPQPQREEEPRSAETSTPMDKPSFSLQEMLERQSLSDFRKAFSLNDRFRFRRELFNGDEAQMNRVINDLNTLHTFEESTAYLRNQLNWNLEEEAAADFIKLLEKRFH